MFPTENFENRNLLSYRIIVTVTVNHTGIEFGQALFLFFSTRLKSPIGFSKIL